MQSTEPFAHTSGPRDAKIVLVGEAWGESEDALKKPFAGYSGKELFRMLWEVWHDVAPHDISLLRKMQSSDSLWVRERESWLNDAGMLCTNVFNVRPPGGNAVENLCVKKAQVPSDYSWPPLKLGHYIDPKYLPEVARLRAELAAAPRNLVIALGNTACWALLRSTKIGALRGAVAAGPGGVKVLPTYHPSAVMRLWSHRPVVIADFHKSRRESAFPEIRRPSRRITVNPTLTEVREWLARPANQYAADIETQKGQIEMISFARSRDDALVVPFAVRNAVGSWQSYWPTDTEECIAWDLVESVLAGPAVKIFQNGMFDMAYLWRAGLRMRNCYQDTMLEQHSMYPELQKGLGFLGSIFTDEPAWKLMRSGKHEELKREE